MCEFCLNKKTFASAVMAALHSVYSLTPGQKFMDKIGEIFSGENFRLHSLKLQCNMAEYIRTFSLSHCSSSVPIITTVWCHTADI